MFIFYIIGQQDLDWTKSLAQIFFGENDLPPDWKNAIEKTYNSYDGQQTAGDFGLQQTSPLSKERIENLNKLLKSKKSSLWAQQTSDKNDESSLCAKLHSNKILQEFIKAITEENTQYFGDLIQSPEQDFKQWYKEIVLLVYPDKCPVEDRKVADELFKFVSNLNDEVKKKN